MPDAFSSTPHLRRDRGAAALFALPLRMEAFWRGGLAVPGEACWFAVATSDLSVTAFPPADRNSPRILTRPACGFSSPPAARFPFRIYAAVRPATSEPVSFAPKHGAVWAALHGVPGAPAAPDVSPVTRSYPRALFAGIFSVRRELLLFFQRTGCERAEFRGKRQRIFCINFWRTIGCA